MKWDAVVDICWFVLPRCRSFGVGAGSGSAVLCVFGADLSPSAISILSYYILVDVRLVSTTT